MKKQLTPAHSDYYGYDDTKEYNVGYIPHKSGTYRIEITEAINNVGQFSTAIQALEMAKEEDEVVIILQCPGGSVDASGAFIYAMRKCEAPIHVIASGGVHSAATHILLAADSFELADNFNSLCHCGYAGSGGGLNEYHPKSDFDKAFLRKQYQAIYEGFLTPEEFDGMMRGDNIWLDAEGWCERAMKRLDYFKAKVEAMEAEQAALEQQANKPVAKKTPAAKKKQPT